MKYSPFVVALFFAIPLFGQVNSVPTTIQKAENELFTVVVQNYDRFTDWAIQEHIPIVGGYRPANIVVLQTTASVFREKIAQNPQVLYATTTSAHPKEELPVPGQNLFVNKINVAQARYPQLNGAGSVMSIKEFRFDSLDVDWQNRVLASPLATIDQTTHASIMASLAAGAGNADPAGRGVAPGCMLLSTGFGVLLPEEDYASQGITVQNHSYGVEIENFYGPNALAYDVSTLENPHLLHVFSAGNKGESAAETGLYANVPGFANLTGNFKMAKNVLIVGAVDSMGEIAFFSSNGPAYDGRIKPGLVAFGHDGTSGAAALVSGAAAVLQQTFREQFDTLASSDMLRAILINTADDRGTNGPDFEYGFGNLNVKNAIRTVLNHHVVHAEVFSGETFLLPIDIPANTNQLKITLAWSDPPAQAGAEKALVHDLDLQLLDPNGIRYRPWVLNTEPHADSLQLPAVRARDTLNNVEQITLDLPIPGQYEIQVSGPQLFSASQTFSIAYHWDTIGHFEWTYPVQDDPAVAAKGAVLAWETNILNVSGQLEWKPVGDVNWRLIDADAVLNKGVRRWVMPDTFTEAQVRMQVGTQLFHSDTFLISKALRMKVGFNCPDSVGLFWNRIAPGAEYQLYGLGQFYLEPLFVTPDTFVVLPKNQFPQQRFAVAALGANSAALSKRSAAPDIRQQGIACYQKVFFAELNVDDQVDITLELGTTYGVTKVVFEKWNQGAFKGIAAFETIDKERFTHTDAYLTQGKNTYRAVIFTSNGGMIWSDTATVYFLGNKGGLVFPNPVAAGSMLKVLSNGTDEAEFRLFDSLGRLVLRETLTENIVEIPLDFIGYGYYFYEIRENGKRLWSGGVVIVR